MLILKVLGLHRQSQVMMYYLAVGK